MKWRGSYDTVFVSRMNSEFDVQVFWALFVAFSSHCAKGAALTAELHSNGVSVLAWPVSEMEEEEEY